MKREKNQNRIGLNFNVEMSKNNLAKAGLKFRHAEVQITFLLLLQADQTHF